MAHDLILPISGCLSWTQQDTFQKPPPCSLLAGLQAAFLDRLSCAALLHLVRSRACSHLSTMTQSTRDAILALRKDKKAMDVFETPETEDASSGAQTTSYYSASGGGSSLTLGRSDRKKNEDVVQLDLRPSLAFAKFAGKIYDSKLAADGSSATPPTKVQPLPFARPPSPTAFSSTNSSSASPFESPIDKFNRLKREIGTFRSDLASLAKEDGSDGDVGELAALLDRELGKLDEQLTGLASEGSTSQLLTDGQSGSDTSDSGIQLVAQLIQKLQQSSNTDTIPSINVNLPAASAFSPSSSAADAQLSTAAVSSLDRRVAALEQTVGLPIGLINATSVRDKLSSAANRPLRNSLSAAQLPSSSSPSASSTVHLSYSSMFPDLYTGVMTLHRKLNLLDASRMDTLRSHIKSITQDMELINPAASTASTASAAANSHSSSSPSSASAVVDVRESGRVSELYELMTRWDAWVGQLPIIVSRLQSVKATHDELRGLADRVKRVETDSAAMDKLLRDDRDSLQKVSTAAASSLDQMSKNLLSMQQRMTALQTKLDALNKK